MQIKEFEAYTLKECLQQVRNALGPEAVILETKKFRKGGILGWGAKDAVRIMAATGIAVQDEFENDRSAPRKPVASPKPKESLALVGGGSSSPAPAPAQPTRSPQMAASAAARSAYARTEAAHSPGRAATATAPSRRSAAEPVAATPLKAKPEPAEIEDASHAVIQAAERFIASGTTPDLDPDRLASLEQTMQEIRETLAVLQREHRDSQERTVSAVVSAVAPAVSHAVSIATSGDTSTSRFPELAQRLQDSGVSATLIQELMDSLPDMSAWSEEARLPLATSALRDLLCRRMPVGGPIKLTPGKLKAVALIGPTGVGKTTTIAKLAARHSLLENKKVALLTVDTYRIAAVEQLKIYSQIIDIPIGVAYSPQEVVAALDQFADFDLLLIDTAGRSQNNIMQIGELKTLLESVHCETHLVLSSPVKESDMLDAAQRFSAARVDRLIFTKLDETSTYGTLFNVADQTGIPISYMTNGQKVPEDLEVADSERFANLLLQQ